MKWLGRFTPYRLDKSDSYVNADNRSMEKGYVAYDLDGSEIFTSRINDRSMFQEESFLIGESDVSKLIRYYGLKNSVMVLDETEDSIFSDYSD